MARDGLIEGIKHARLSGSEKTKFAHKQEAGRFVEELREQGHGVQKWQNVTSRQLADVAEAWVNRGLAASTVHEYVSGVRQVAMSYGNDHLATASKLRDVDGNAFLDSRQYVTNQDKSVPQAAYEKAYERLASGEFGRDGQCLAEQMKLARYAGLRHEESRKADPLHTVRRDGTLEITEGTKGALHRWNANAYPEAREALHALVEFRDPKYHNTMQAAESAWEAKAYRMLHEVGIGRNLEAGASFHGLRHAYAHDRYHDMTGFDCPAKGGTIEAAQAVAGEGWRALDREARDTLKTELGHGMDRDAVISLYVGSWG